MNNTILIFILTVGIILIKIFWIHTEIKFFRTRVNRTMLKTNLIEAVILILQILAAIYFPLPKIQLSQAIVIVGVGMYITGAFLALWARVAMDKVWGIPGEYSKNQDKLITTGPFAFSRNPIYLGFLLLYFGFAIAIMSWLVILRIPLLIYFYKSAKAEEKILEEKFGSKYLTYKSSVPRFF